MELRACSFWISALSSAETSLHRREVGERQKESARGTMGRGGNKKRYPPRHQSFSSSHHPPHAYLFLILFLFGSQRWPVCIREGQANALRPGYPRIKGKRMLFVKHSMYVWLAKFVFYAGKRYQFMITRCSKLAVKKINMD